MPLYPKPEVGEPLHRILAADLVGCGAGNSGDKSPAIQTLCVGRAAPNIAPASGLRVLEHRFVRHSHEVTAWDGGHFHFGVRVKTEAVAPVAATPSS